MKSQRQSPLAFFMVVLFSDCGIKTAISSEKHNFLRILCFFKLFCTCISHG